MQWSLFLLFLAGQCSFVACCLYEYHFIRINKTRDDAQAYCREKYTDLATVCNMTDMKRLSDVVNGEAAWIGLYSNPGSENKKWHWSLPGVEFKSNETARHQRQPNDVGGHQNCVLIKNERWNDKKCSKQCNFICYDEKIHNKKFHLINKEKKTWPEAQKYCRKHHTDLVSGLEQLQNGDLKKEIQCLNQRELWIGLFRDTWRWSDGSNFSFRNSDLELLNDDRVKKCAMTVSKEKWSAADCQTEKPFVCYDDKVILIKKNKTWKEALNYCRQHYHDLVSITNLHQQRWVQERAKKADTPYVWMGLRYSYTLDLWYWVSDHLVCYDNWAPHENTKERDRVAAMDRGGQHKWFKKDDAMRFNFICALKRALNFPNP